MKIRVLYIVLFALQLFLVKMVKKRNQMQNLVQQKSG